MKTLLGLFLLTGVAYAQEPLKTIRRDSLPKVFPLDVVSSDENPIDRMPNARPDQFILPLPDGFPADNPGYDGSHVGESAGFLDAVYHAAGFAETG